MEVNIHNNSPNKTIFIALNNPEDGFTPDPFEEPIQPSQTSKRRVNFATMNLFVWIDPSEKPIWIGVIPTKVQKIINIFPERKEVKYDNTVLPSGFNPVTNLQEANGLATINNGKNYVFLKIIAILFMITILVFTIFWLAKYIRKT